MKSAITVAAFAGITAAASAQSLSVRLSFDKTSVSLGESFTATLTASFTGFADGAYLSSINIDLLANAPRADVSNVSAVAWNNAGLGFDGQGTASGADVLGIEASQFSLIPPFTTDNPVLITTFTVTWNGGVGLFWYTPVLADGAPFMFSVTGPGFADQPVTFNEEAFTSQAFNFIPAPGSAAVLVLCGVLAGRGRRAV
ncbi:MAG: hypothetical protein AAGA55_04050 [Planctomycetota bacterium]